MRGLIVGKVIRRLLVTMAASVAWLHLPEFTWSASGEIANVTVTGPQTEAAPATSQAGSAKQRSISVSSAGNKQAADRLDGPPFVTAKAWAVADGRTGKILWGHQESQAVDIASTTKIMTAILVIRAAAADPKVLDETVIFSERADQTIGSTSGIRAGERLSVHQLLYGMLLPSGNDAAVAFGEHFGSRLKPKATASTKSDPLLDFVAEMNRVAAELELHETHFINPNGLTAPGHHSSARDLARLTHTALSHRLFASTVATVHHETTVSDEKGERRLVNWSNTNDLLKIQGYDGVKTGTTQAAGSCLVASGHRDRDHLIVVILGASSSEGRYVDARNLFRWAWIMRGHESVDKHQKEAGKTE